MSKQLTAEVISATQFAAFGELLENKTDQRRQDFSLQFAVGVQPQLWVNRLRAYTGRQILVDVMESHPHSTQTFVPMQPGRCLIVVAPSGADGKPDISALRAFVTKGGQGISYRPNVWHYTFTSLDGPNEVVVIMGYGSASGDTIIEPLVHPVAVNFQQGEHYE